MPDQTEISLSSLVRPSPKQREFLEALDLHKYVLYGGAKGGGKSFILRWSLVKLLLKWATLGHKNVHVMLACEDYPSLKDRQVQKIQVEFPDWLGKLADSQISGLSFTLHPHFGGGVISLRNLDDPSKYASAEYAAIAIDELTKNPEEVFQQLRSIMRWPGIDETKFLAATNPGGLGHLWVRRYWIDRDFPEGEPEAERFYFVQAFAKDNPYLSPFYVKQLEGLSPALRKAYLEGSWDLFEGQFFEEWDASRHVVKPFEIPSSWKRVLGVDHGRAAPTAALWGAVDFDGRIYWYREYYERGRDADVNAKNIVEMTGGEPLWFRVLDSACFSKTGTGETIAEIYERNGLRCYPSPKDRKAGWALFHEYLRPDGDGLPRMFFFETCRNAIRTIPSLVYDKHEVEDLDSKGEDHSADAVSYVLQTLHEGRSRPEISDPVARMLERQKERGRLSPSTLKDFYRGKKIGERLRTWYNG